MSLKVLLTRTVRLFPSIQQNSHRQFFTNSALAGRGKTNWKYLSKECEERTSIVLKDRARLENLYTAPEFNQNLKNLFHFFPLSPDKVEGILLDHPHILNHDSSRVIEYIKILVDAGDYDIITQEEALLCLARCPELLKINRNKFKANITNIFGLSSIYDIPWNMVIVASPSRF